jgi:hypothetical protein
MKYIISVFLFITLGILFTYFSYFLQIDQNIELIKLIIFLVAFIPFLFFNLLYFHFYTIKDLVSNINLIIFPIAFVSSAFLSEHIYTYFLYYGVDRQITMNNFKNPDNYMQFLNNWRSLNQKEMYNYLNDKNDLLIIDKETNNILNDYYNKYKLNNNNNKYSLNKKINNIFSDNLVSYKELNLIKDELTFNNEVLKNNNYLNEIYKISINYKGKKIDN